jgi:hypothetical protein
MKMNNETEDGSLDDLLAMARNDSFLQKIMSGEIKERLELKLADTITSVKENQPRRTDPKITSFAWHPSDKYFAIVIDKKEIFFYELDSKKLYGSIEIPYPVEAIAFCPEMNKEVSYLCVGGEHLSIFEMLMLTESFSIADEHDYIVEVNDVKSLAFSKGFGLDQNYPLLGISSDSFGVYLGAFARKGIVNKTIHELTLCNQLAQVYGALAGSTFFAAADGKKLFFIGEKEMQPELVKEFDSSIVSLSMQDGLCAVACEDKSVMVLSGRNQIYIKEFPEDIVGIAFAHNEPKLAVGYGKEIEIYDVNLWRKDEE